MNVVLAAPVTSKVDEPSAWLGILSPGSKGNICMPNLNVSASVIQLPSQPLSSAKDTCFLSHRIVNFCIFLVGITLTDGEGGSGVCSSFSSFGTKLYW